MCNIPLPVSKDQQKNLIIGLNFFLYIIHSMNSQKPSLSIQTDLGALSKVDSLLTKTLRQLSKLQANNIT
jgi:hypothetical protein